MLNCLVISLSHWKTDWDIFQKSVSWWPERLCIWRWPQKSSQGVPFCVNLKSFSLKLRGKQGKKKKDQIQGYFLCQNSCYFFFPLWKINRLYLGLCVSLPWLYHMSCHFHSGTITFDKKRTGFWVGKKEKGKSDCPKYPNNVSRHPHSLCSLMEIWFLLSGKFCA